MRTKLGDKRIKYTQEDVDMIMAPRHKGKWTHLAEYFGTSKKTLQCFHLAEKHRRAQGNIVCRTSEGK